MSTEKLRPRSRDLYTETCLFLLGKSDIIGQSAIVTTLEKTPEGEYRAPIYPSAKSNDPMPETISLHVMRGEKWSQNRWFLSSNASSIQTEVDFVNTTPRCVAYDMGVQNQLISYRELNQEESQETAELIFELLSHPDTLARLEGRRNRLLDLQREMGGVTLKTQKGRTNYQKLINHRASLEASMKFPPSSVSSQEKVMAKVSYSSYKARS